MQDRVNPKPPRMVRKQLLISPDQNRRIGAVASEQGRSESEVVRDAIEAWLAAAPTGAESWKSAWIGSAGIWRDRSDIDELMGKRRDRRRARRERLAKQSARDSARK